MCSAAVGAWSALAMGLAGCSSTVSPNTDGGADVGFDVVRDGGSTLLCRSGNVPYDWSSETRVLEPSADRQCPLAVEVHGYAGSMDCGMFDACCSFSRTCRFRVDFTFHDDRPDPCTRRTPCFPPQLHQRTDCRCENGRIRCDTFRAPLFPFQLCSDCHLPVPCPTRDGG
jgi:hypothetical protein